MAENRSKSSPEVFKPADVPVFLCGLCSEPGIGCLVWKSNGREPVFSRPGSLGCTPFSDKNPDTGTFFELLEDDFGTQFYETEIARRFSHFSQPIHQIDDAGVSAVLIGAACAGLVPRPFSHLLPAPQPLG